MSCRSRALALGLVGVVGLAVSCAKPRGEGESAALQVSPGDEVWIVFDEVRAYHEAEGWQLVSDAPRTVDLLALDEGVLVELSGAALPAGTYTEVRLRVRDQWVVIGGQRHPLIVPSGSQSGLKLVHAFTLAPGETVSLHLDFATGAHLAANDSGYLLRPVLFVTSSGSEQPPEAVPSRLVFLDQPVDTPEGATMLTDIRIAVTDEAGVTVATATHVVSLALVNGGTATLTAEALSVAAVNGIATFSGLSVSALGTGYRLEASAPNLAPATSAPFDCAAIRAAGVLGQPDFTSTALGASLAQLAGPIGCALDTSGNLWIADSLNNRVLRFPGAASLEDGAPADLSLGGFAGISATNMFRPAAVLVDAAGTLWVADTLNHRVLRFDDAASLQSGAAADGVLGQASFVTATAGAGLAQLNQPTGLAADGTGRLLVVDRLNHRVLWFDGAADKPNGADADGMLGQGEATTSLSGFQQPYSATWSGDRLFVADASNHRVLWFDGLQSGTAAGVLGQAIFPSVTRAHLNSPLGVRVDQGRARVFVADTFNNRVLIFGGALTSGMEALSLLGAANFTTASFGLPGPTTLSRPTCVASDDAGHTWVVENVGNRVVRYDLP
jgi:DNA-binding beta-propeller fold protein YncE